MVVHLLHTEQVISSNLIITTKLWKCGRVWFIAPVLKTDDLKRSVSSNLTASANF